VIGVVLSKGWCSNQASFYPGYIIAMLPAGWAVQKFGAKLMLGLDNYLMGAALLLIPTAAKMGVMPLCLCMAATGVSQAPIFPGQVCHGLQRIPCDVAAPQSRECGVLVS
jgi:hypothetical protein